MRILTFILITTLAFTAGCGKPRPLSPRESFEALRIAYHKKDVDRVISLYSKDTITSYTEAIRLINGMSDDQRKKLFETNMIPAAEKITLSDFVRFHITAQSGEGNDPVIDAFNHIITSISVNGKKAVVRTDNGVELLFVQEGIFWHFSPEGR
ncbi:MAG TPA: hypothetical protein VF857_08455 [Spirochaetota bacterium]